jgi:hypothetical protein
MEVHPPSFISKILLVGTARKVEKNFFYFGAQRRRLVHSGEARMANDEHVTILKKGTAPWNAWRDENPNIRRTFRRLRTA